MIIREFRGVSPKIGKNCFIADTAAVIGDVSLGSQCSVWYSAVIRGDVNSIRIGDRVSIQDGTVIHVSSTEGGDVNIGSDVVIGHNATVHACNVGNRCLIGMGSTILDGAVVGEGSIVAAGALVLGKTVIGPNEMWAGVPASFVKKISPEVVERTIMKGVASYAELAGEYSSR